MNKVKIENARYWPILNYLPASLLKNVRLVYVFGHGASDVLLATNDDKLFVFGFNSLGCLGYESVRRYGIDSLDEIEVLSKKRIKGFAFNTNSFSKVFVLAYLENGEVYSWGHDPSDPHVYKHPSLIETLPKTVIEVACGSQHVMVLTSAGEVFAWGENGKKQISYSDDDIITVPVKICQSVVKISCGDRFSVVLTSEGAVFSWGENEDGQLGLNTISDCEGGPNEVVLLTFAHIVDIACGSNHVLALDDHGDVYSWGLNDYQQLGCDNVDDRSFPSKLVQTIRFKEVAAQNCFSCGVSFDGSVKVWGRTAGEAHANCISTPCRTIDEAFALFHCENMYKPIEIAPENETVSETLRKSLGNPEDSDFKFVVDKKEIHVHKTVLKLRSQYFKRMFQGDYWLEANTSSVQIDENYEALVAFLKYLYTGELEVNPRVALEVAVLADKYCESNLIDVCLQTFKQGLDKINMAELYELTFESKMTNFSELCIDFASYRLPEIITSNGFHCWKADTYQSFFKHHKIIQACSR